MAVTLTTQTHLWPASSTTGFTDGDGMATRIAYDMALAVNNLAAYVDCRVNFAASVDPASITGGKAGFASIVPKTTSAEMFVTQFPISVNPDVKRVALTADLEAVGTSGVGGGITTVTALSFYFARRPYQATADGATAFDTANLEPRYITTSSTFSITGNTTTPAAFRLVDLSTTGFNAPAIPPETGSRGNEESYLIITATCQGSHVGEDNKNFVRVFGVAAWGLYE